MTLFDKNNRDLLLLFIGLTAGIAGITWVNVMTIFTEAEINNEHIVKAHIWLYEISSGVVTLCIMPALYWFNTHLGHKQYSLKQLIPIHILGSVLYSFTHVSTMVGIRKLFHNLLFDSTYHFFGDVITVSLYEYRKDLMAYFLFTIVMVLFIRWQKDQSALEVVLNKPERLTIDNGATQFHIDLDKFIYAKAAGNYAEVYTTDETMLIRISLKGLEDKISGAQARAVRLHKSYLVNPQAISSSRPKGDGDLIIKLSSGEEIPCSRRYRQNLSVSDN